MVMVWELIGRLTCKDNVVMCWSTHSSAYYIFKLELTKTKQNFEAWAFQSWPNDTVIWKVFVYQSLQLLGWLVAAPFILATLYIILLPCFKFLVNKFSSVPLSPKKPLHSLSDVRLKVRDVWLNCNKQIFIHPSHQQGTVVICF